VNNYCTDKINQKDGEQIYGPTLKCCKHNYAITTLLVWALCRMF